MNVIMLVPATEIHGAYLETVAIFAARRCRTTQTHAELWDEVSRYSDEKRRTFLEKVVTQDWAADVLEMIHLVYDLEGVPVWLIIELLRHRLVAREFSLEQLSQRAISASKLRVETPGSLRLQQTIDDYIENVTKIGSEEHIPPEELREAFPQGVLVNLVIAGNLRAFHHFFWMRSSPLFGGKGGAHSKFMELADKMQAQAREVLPVTMGAVLKA